MPDPGTSDGLPDLGLIRPGRMHEATGAGRRAFAAAPRHNEHAHSTAPCG